jgi:hypothetical protein
MLVACQLTFIITPYGRKVLENRDFISTRIQTGEIS